MSCNTRRRPLRNERCKLLVHSRKDSKTRSHSCSTFDAELITGGRDRQRTNSRGKAGAFTDREAQGPHKHFKSDAAGCSRAGRHSAGGDRSGISALPGAAAGPQGQLTWGVHISLAPTWFDPAETPGIITPFMVLYALHDAMVKPMPGNPMAPSLAESWSASEDGLTYEFVLRQGVKFHNGDPVTAEDVKFSFERYRGASHEMMKSRVAAIETPDPAACPLQAQRAVARLPDFLCRRPPARAGSCPRNTSRRSATTGSRRRPIGAGPYKFVSFTPGVELVFEAFDRYWRKTPSVKRLVFKVIPEETDAAGRAEARRGRHRLLDPRRTRRGAAAHAGADASSRRPPRPVLALLSRPMGPEIAVARRAGAAGR